MAANERKKNLLYGVSFDIPLLHRANFLCFPYFAITTTTNSPLCPLSPSVFCLFKHRIDRQSNERPSTVEPAPSKETSEVVSVVKLQGSTVLFTYHTCSHGWPG